jgi:hypothetical protein
MDDDRKVTGESSETPRMQNVDEGPHVGFIEADEFEDRVMLERHERHDPHNRGHVDLMQEEYTPEEVSRLIGTSLEVVMHAIWSGDLKADRKGHAVVCIKHADVTEWLHRRQQA